MARLNSSELARLPQAAIRCAQIEHMGDLCLQIKEDPHGVEFDNDRGEISEIWVPAMVKVQTLTRADLD